MNRILIVVLSLWLSGVGAIAAQTPGRAPGVAPPAGAGEIRGIVVDSESNTPLTSAAVALWSAADSALVTGAVTRADGSFRIEGLRPGRYYLRVSTLGYAAWTSAEVTIAEASPRTSVGTLRLTRSAIALDGVEVEVDRPTISMAPDRNTYRARDIAPAGGSASDVLQAVPSVQVDADGKVSLRGNENVAVQINGRPAPMRGAQLAGYLQQLPANLVERVEVIPNPSARYDPDGMAGIINIVMKQDADLGVSGGFTLGAATAERYTASGNLGYQRGPLTLFTFYGFNLDERKITGINDRERHDALRTPLWFSEQEIAGEASNGGHNLSANLDYRLSRRDVLSTSLMANRRSATEASLSAYSEFDAARALTARYDRLRDSDGRNRMLDYTLAFKRTLEPQRHELATELRFNRSDERDRTDLWRQPLGTGAQSVGRLEAENNRTDALTYQLTAQADYTRPLAARTKLETGYKGNARWLDRDYTVVKDPLGSGDWARSELSNAFEFDEQVHAIYGVLTQGAGRFELQGGLRAEYADRDFALADESFPHDYTSFFPSAIVSYTPREGSLLKASYSRRIRRPGTWELNPFPVFFDAQNVFIGNPNLNPEYTDAFELGYQRTGRLGSLQISPFYRRTSDIIRFIINTADVIDGREVTSVSFQNLETGSSWGSDVNGSLRFGKRFSGLGSFNVFKMVTEGSGGETSLSSDAVSWSARLSANAELTRSLTLQAMYFYRAPMNIERGRFSSFSMTNLTLRQKLPGDRATLSLRFADPFNTMGFRVEAGDDNLTQITERRFDARAVHLTLQYSFGQAPRIRQRRPEQAPEGGPGFPQ
jgi:ferric enterobactin receptor